MVFFKRIANNEMCSLMFILCIANSAIGQSDSCKFSKYYYPNKKIKEEGCKVADKKERIWKEYDEGGILLFEWTYKNGLKNGGYKKFFDNGKINVIGKYYNDQLVDTVRIFDQKSNLVSETIWTPNEDGSSEMIGEKIYKDDIKPDYTIEEIDGISYIWLYGERQKVSESTKTSKKKRRKK